MNRQVQQKFIRGINRRFSIQNQDDPSRLYTCQNARIQKRGETGQVSRIKGFSNLTEYNLTGNSDNVLDSLFYKNKFIFLWEQTGEVTLNVYDIDTAINSSIDLGNLGAVGNGSLQLLEDTIYIQPYNIQINNILDTFYSNNFKSETPVFTAAEGIETLPFPPPDNPEPGTVGYLELGEVYWYKIRAVYKDNHKTVTTFPQRVKIQNTKYVVLTADFPPDLDNGFVRVEIFRKKGEENFFLIDRVTTNSLNGWQYTDSGKTPIRGFSDNNYVWADSAKAQAIVRNRMVLGNLEFFERNYDPDVTISLATNTNTDESLIPDTIFEIYTRKRYEDGLLSPHEQVGLLSPTEYDQVPLIDQVGSVEKEVAFYLGYDRSIKPEQNIITFPTFEIYNSELPSILTKDDPEADQDKPVSPHLFLGWGQIRRSHDGSGNYEHVIRDAEWTDDTTSSGELYTFDSFTGPNSTPEEVMPRYLEIEVMPGHTVLYKLIASQNNGLTANNGVYEIAWLDGLKDYISTRQLKMELSSLLNGKSISSSKTENEFKTEQTDVIGYRDLSESEPNKFVVGGSGPFPALLNRVYLLFGPDSILSEVDSPTFNNNDVDTNWDSTVDLTPSALFELLNIKYVRDESPTSTSETQEGNNYLSWTYDDKVIQPAPEINLENSVIYLGSTSETGSKQYSAGIEKVDTDNFAYWRVPPHAIIEGLITSEDLEIFQQDYQNLLIWSEPYLIGTGVNGIRNFTFTNFKTISQDYGPIVDIKYINRVLLVFCERGVNQINVGETLTQQASGEVFVSSAQFLTNDFWILRNLPNIEVDSIKEYENMLFFCDGRDVWMFIESPKNITNGAIDISDVQSAAIDPLNKEYRISTSTETWAYSIELNEWFGPYTYTEETSATYRNRMFSVKDDTIVEHNIGNDFGGAAYETVVESVSLDLGNVAVDKLWRKFLLQLDGQIPETSMDELLEFSYGREYDSKVVKNLFEVAKKSNLFHIGIVPNEKNSTQLYWQIRTNIANFTLRSFAYDLSIRNRP